MTFFIKVPVDQLADFSETYKMLTGEEFSGVQNAEGTHILAGSGRLFDKHAELLRRMKYGAEVTEEPPPDWIEKE